jgi:hypothetical protein
MKTIQEQLNDLKEEINKKIQVVKIISEDMEIARGLFKKERNYENSLRINEIEYQYNVELSALNKKVRLVTTLKKDYGIE